MRAALVLAAKDLRIFARDRTGLLLTVLLPVFLATIFGLAMGGMAGDGELPPVELLVEDRDRSAASAALADDLAAGGALRVVRLPEDAPEGAARERVARGSAPAALVVPAGWSAGEADLLLLRDPAKTVEQQVVAGALLPALLGGADGRALAPGLLAELGDPAAGRELDLEVEDVAGGGELSGAAQRVAGQSHAVSGMAVMMLMFGLVACGGTLLQERDAGTLQRLRLAAGAGPSILAGKFLFTAAVGAGQLALLFVYGHLVFDVPIFRAPVALVVHSAAVLSATTSLGMLFAVACRTQKQLEGLSTLVILVMSALGGAWFPLAMTPELFRFVGHFTLTAWAMDGYQGLFWYGRDLSGILPQVGVLAAAALVLGALAVRLWRTRWEGPR